MATQRRFFVEGEFYHIYNRGNHKESVYHEARDYERFLWLLSDAAAINQVTVTAYCLMPNHFHLLVRPDEGGSIGKCMTSLSVAYVKYYNKRYGTVGRLFQDRYRDRLVRDEVDLLNLSRYIHLNPEGMVDIDRYEWSSLRAYLGESSRFCDPRPVLDAAGMGPYSYAIFCSSRSIPEVQGITGSRSSRS